MGNSSRLERNFRNDLRARGLYFDHNCRDLPGTPDIVFRRSKIAVFVHGCYWHRHKGCNLANHPKTGVSYWLGVFNGIVNRDIDARTRLEIAGWTVVVVWECEIRADENARLNQVDELIRSQRRP